jgi:hypothetical protein
MNLIEHLFTFNKTLKRIFIYNYTQLGPDKSACWTAEGQNWSPSRGKSM